MKNLFIFLVLSISLVGCVPSATLTKEQTEKIYSHEVNLKKDELKRKLLLYVNETFVSGKTVLQTNEDGLLSGNGIVDLKKIKGLMGETISIIKMELTFIIKYDDGNYKVKWVVKDLSNEKGIFSRDYWGYYTADIEKTIADNDKELSDYVSNKANDF